MNHTTPHESLPIAKLQIPESVMRLSEKLVADALQGDRNRLAELAADAHPLEAWVSFADNVHESPNTL